MQHVFSFCLIISAFFVGMCLKYNVFIFFSYVFHRFVFLSFRSWNYTSYFKIFYCNLEKKIKESSVHVCTQFLNKDTFQNMQEEFLYNVHISRMKCKVIIIDVFEFLDSRWIEVLCPGGQLWGLWTMSRGQTMGGVWHRPLCQGTGTWLSTAKTQRPKMRVSL